jgi:REP element-mobilizing transposase RayT
VQRARSRRQASHRQLELPLPAQWGGRRRGAGRRPKGERALVPHRPRAGRSGREPVHVTMKLRRGLPRLRVRAAVAVLWACMARGRDRFGFRLCEFSIQGDHLHLIAEAADRRALARGMQGLAVRCARKLNRLWGRKGTVFADRYHDHVLRTPREVRNALCYVLNNAQHHLPPPIRRGLPAPDPFSSARWFDGYRAPPPTPPPFARCPTVAARTWLLTTGWRRHGAIGLDESPGSRPR